MTLERDAASTWRATWHLRGHRSWDALHEHRGDGGSIAVTFLSRDAEKSVDLPCRDAVRPRPLYLRIVSRQPR